MKDPERRLGAGRPGSDFDVNALKAHPFFNELNWDKLDVRNDDFDLGVPTINLSGATQI